jgi:hypothetical protein
MGKNAEELRFGVIGCGGMARQVHCPNLAAVPGARTVAYCDIDGRNGTMTVRDAAYILAVEKAILRSVEMRQVVEFPEFLRENRAGFLLEGRG